MKIIFRIFTGMIVLTLFTVMGISAAETDMQVTMNTSPELLCIIQDRGVLVVAIEPLGAPYADLIPGSIRNSTSKCCMDCYTSDQMSGFDIDVTKAISLDLGVEPCYVTPDYEELLWSNWSEWDLYPGYYITNDRLDRYYFTIPTVSESSRFYIRTNESDVASPSDLSGKKIGVTTLSAQFMYLNNTLDLPGVIYENPVNNPVISEYGTEYEAIDDLLSGNLDSVLISESTGNDKIATGTPIIGLSPVAFTGYSGLTISKEKGYDAKSFIRRLDEIITQMHTDGELSNISMVNLGKDITLDSSTFDAKSLSQFP